MKPIVLKMMSDGQVAARGKLYGNLAEATVDLTWLYASSFDDGEIEVDMILSSRGEERFWDNQPVVRSGLYGRPGNENHAS